MRPDVLRECVVGDGRWYAPDGATGGPELPPALQGVLMLDTEHMELEQAKVDLYVVRGERGPLRLLARVLQAALCKHREIVLLTLERDADGLWLVSATQLELSKPGEAPEDMFEYLVARGAEVELVRRASQDYAPHTHRFDDSPKRGSCVYHLGEYAEFAVSNYLSGAFRELAGWCAPHRHEGYVQRQCERIVCDLLLWPREAVSAEDRAETVAWFAGLCERWKEQVRKGIRAWPPPRPPAFVRAPSSHAPRLNVIRDGRNADACYFDALKRKNGFTKALSAREVEPLLLVFVKRIDEAISMRLDDDKRMIWHISDERHIGCSLRTYLP